MLRSRCGDQHGLIVKASFVGAAYDFPRGLNHDGSLGSRWTSARECHLARECLLSGLRIELVLKDVVEHRFVHENFVTRVVAVLIDEWTGVEGLAEIGQHCRGSSDLADDSHTGLVTRLALR